MDAAARSELAALRRRAYGPDADIAGDKAAWERLSALEELALADRSMSAPAPPGVGGTVDPTPDAPAARRLSPRRLLIGGLLASVALSAIALTAVPGLQTVPDPLRSRTAIAGSPVRPDATEPTLNGRVSIPLLVDRATGDFIDASSPSAPASLRVDGVTTWAQPLGAYYGWALWVSRVSSRHGPESCLLLTDGTATHARCIPHAPEAEGVVRVSLAFGELADDRRPRGMTPDQRVRFEWGGGAYLTMEIDDS
jgi:hypothetical protein